MSNYGRNFEFRIAPHSKNRLGRNYNAEGAAIPIGAPVVLDTAGDDNTLALSPFALAAEADDRPVHGSGGLAIYEHIRPDGFNGSDPVLTNYSDLNLIAAGAAIQVVNGDNVKVLLRNTVDHTFLNSRSYTGFTMVAGLSATPTISVGDYLTPGVGNSTDGFWKGTSTASEGWLYVVKVDAERLEVEATVLF